MMFEVSKVTFKVYKLLFLQKQQLLYIASHAFFPKNRIETREKPTSVIAP